MHVESTGVVDKTGQRVLHVESTRVVDNTGQSVVHVESTGVVDTTPIRSLEDTQLSCPSYLSNIPLCHSMYDA